MPVGSSSLHCWLASLIFLCGVSCRLSPKLCRSARSLGRACAWLRKRKPQANYSVTLALGRAIDVAGAH
ncbi:hypothetical protein PR003_g32315 [Phytophthora rubi]|uniref:Secreted protein n=1 Tax=Phytophthora rubi TaxID=129364 RepID=A0A6A3GZF4_9STRA|nr:hypothetical protein PR002_g29618 [Phytophthora rubi]KAE9265883.1 hypothetical protein PR003_g32315 [Phytophthora rubi]